MLLKLAWRNIWRNPRRTGIAMAALALGAAALVFTHCFAESMYGSMVELTTRGLLGQVRVHGAGYGDDPDLYTVVKEPQAVSQRIEEALPGAHTLFRVAGQALVASEDRSSAGMVLGLDPVAEAAHSGVLHLAQGATLSGGGQREVVLGDKLARRLRATVGSEVVMLGQAADGSMANDLYTVVGISSGGATTELQGNVAFLHLAQAQAFYALGSSVHQVVVVLPDGVVPRAASAALRAKLDPATLEALAWNELVPEIEMGIEADRQGTYFMDVIVFLLVVLGIVNAMTMATYERTHELGVLMAVGTQPGRMLALVVTEALCLGVVSATVGVAVGAGIISAIGSIDLSASEGAGGFGGAAMPSSLSLRLVPMAVVMATSTVLATCFFGGLLPAFRVARLNPVDAMRER